MNGFGKTAVRRLAALVVVSSMALTACGVDAGAAPAPSAGSPISITVAEQGIAGISAGMPAHIADELGFFKEEGLAVEFVVVTKGSDALSGLMSDAVKIFHGADGMIAASEGGGVVGIGALTDRSIWTLVANKKIANWADLEGETIALSSTSDVTRSVFNKVAGQGGVDPTKVDYVALGAPSQRVTAVKNGQATATFTTYPSAESALKEGLNNLGFSPAGVEVPAMVTSEIVASKAWAQKNPEQVQAYLRAIRKSLDYVKDPKNAEDVAKIVSKLNKEPTESILKALDIYYLNPAQVGYFPDDFRHMEGAFDATVKAYQELGLMRKTITEAEYMDYSFADAALGR
jgi:NitT/TauT family transport system substrate-binding protein